METHRNDWKLWSPGPKEKKNQLGGQSGGGEGQGGNEDCDCGRPFVGGGRHGTEPWPGHHAAPKDRRGCLCVFLPSFLSSFLSLFPPLFPHSTSSHLVCVFIWVFLTPCFFLFCFPASLKGRLELFLCTLFDPCLPSFTGFFFWGGSLIAYFRPQLMQSSTWVVALLPSVLYSLFNTPSVKKGEGLGT